MYQENIIHPVPLRGPAFFDQGDESLSRYTLAAYLLMSGMLFVNREETMDERIDLPTNEEFDVLGINTEITEQVLPGRFDFREFAQDVIDSVPLSELAEFASFANEQGDPDVAALLVALGCNSDDELIRICALGSAVDFFHQPTVDIPGQIAWFLRNAVQPETFELLSVLLARINPSPALGYTPPTVAPQTGAATGLMAVHGTVLPTSQANRPEWSVPPSGSLFSHIKKFRKDIYASPDYFRWEGGYTDYAREVAMTNLCDWVNRRGLLGIDVVAHSHGCNVVLGSTSLGIDYKKIVLLSCPVHWHKYSLRPAKITSDVVSIRTKMDLVIAMDRGGQRFPSGTIKDVILPLWFTSHGATTKPSTWKSQNLDQYLK